MAVKLEKLKGSMRSSDKVFTVSILRDLENMVREGQITSSKMVELMNEAVKWQNVGVGMSSGNKYLRDMVSDLKDNGEALIK